MRLYMNTSIHKMCLLAVIIIVICMHIITVTKSKDTLENNTNDFTKIQLISFEMSVYFSLCFFQHCNVYI